MHETMSALKKEIHVNPFRSLKFFVACQSLLQFTQLMTSGYVKGSISTIEKRFGFSSQTSGLVASFNEVGNTLLIVFVSYFGSRVHRPRIIGCGAVLISFATFIIALPQFLLDIYEYDVSLSGKSNLTDICVPGQVRVSETEQCNTEKVNESRVALFLLLLGQALLGIGTVPIQPFGISYIDDFANKSNSPVYLGIIFAATMLGPAVAFMVMSVMLSIYIDIDKVSVAEINLTPDDPRWVGAWWLGFLLASTLAALAAVPYFFFPRELPKEEENPQAMMEELSKSNMLKVDRRKPEDLSLWEFIKMFPKVLIRNFKKPIFVVMILALISLSAMVAGVATFMGKFLESQFTLTASYANMLIGSAQLPVAVLGTLLGGIIMKKFNLSLKRSALLCIAGLGLCLLFEFPLFFLGCPTQAVAGLRKSRSSVVGGRLVFECNQKCNCSSTAFNPVCGENNIEYVSPCYAGCSALRYDVASMEVLDYSQCKCIMIKGAAGTAVPGTCGTRCSRFLTPFVVFACIAGFMASLTYTPSFMLILRNVKAEDKSLAIGIQFLLLRLAAWLPAPVIYGTVIDGTCLLWQQKCKKKAACRYYDSNAFRHRFIGLQVAFVACCFICFVVVYFLYSKKEQSKQRPPAVNRQDEVLEQTPEESS